MLYTIRGFLPALLAMVSGADRTGGAAGRGSQPAGAVAADCLG